MTNKSLPKGFKYLLSKKEIKQLAVELNIEFDEIHFGNIVHNERLKPDERKQFFLHPISISAKRNEDSWVFAISLFGIRNELIPDQHEYELITGAKNAIKQYVPKILTSTEADFLKRPQLWIYTSIQNEKVFVSTKEIK